MQCNELFDLTHSLLGEVLYGRLPWEVLPHLKGWLWHLGETLEKEGYHQVEPGVLVSSSASIAPTACLVPPAIIGEESVVRHGAYLRGGVLLGRGCVVGNSSEVKNAILFDEAKAPHFNYIGDSILGYRTHLGAGAVLSNVRCDKREVRIPLSPPVPTGLTKVGGFLGDGCEVGCHAVINPGSILGKGCMVYPLTSVSGVYAAGTRIGGKHG